MKRRAPSRPATAPASAAFPRIVLLDLARDPDGLPRPAVLFPGRRLPTVFRSIGAALAATRKVETRA